MTSASSPPLKQRISFSYDMRSSLARSCLLAINGNKMGKCLLRAGPKLSEAFTRLSIAAKYSSFDLDLRQRWSSIVFYFMIMATMVLSSTISFGLKSTLDRQGNVRDQIDYCRMKTYFYYVRALSTMLFYATESVSSSFTKPARFYAW